MLTPTLRSKVDQLWDKFWSGGIANPLAAMEQISYLLFIRRLDAMDRKLDERARQRRDGPRHRREGEAKS